jgi:hypothetical protein
MRKEIKALKHHAGAAALSVDLALGQLVQAAISLAVSLQLAVEEHPTGGDDFKLINAPQQR